MKRKYLDLSTGHLKQETMEALQLSGLYSPDGLYSYPYEEGAFVSIGAEDEENLVQYPELKKIVDYCRLNSIDLIRFDRDAPVSKLFVEFNW